MKRLLTVMVLGWMAAAQTAFAQSGPVVVELFTSQGCSSCPPADALMHKLAKRDDVLALSLHVDYWDYIGWKDKFGKPAHTARQKAYAHSAGRSSIYTPQMIIGGHDSVVGTHPMDVADLIRAHAARGGDVQLAAQLSGGKISLDAKSSRKGAMQVTLVRFSPSRSVDIRRGENAGKRITYVNVVSDVNVIANWDGSRPLQMTFPVSGTSKAAILIHKKGPGQILAAAKLD